jgi:hypothetical protein
MVTLKPHPSSFSIMANASDRTFEGKVIHDFGSCLQLLAKFNRTDLRLITSMIDA